MADWVQIEGAYRAGGQSLRELASAHGITEGAIRARAKKYGWIADIAGTKRQMVIEKVTGIAQGVTQCVMRNLEDAAEQDANDMSLGLQGARAALRRSTEALNDVGSEMEPRDLKTLSECIKINVETIRTIRELNAPSVSQPGANAPVLIQIVAVGAQINES